MKRLMLLLVVGCFAMPLAAQARIEYVLGAADVFTPVGRIREHPQTRELMGAEGFRVEVRDERISTRSLVSVFYMPDISGAGLRPFATSFYDRYVQRDFEVLDGRVVLTFRRFPEDPGSFAIMRPPIGEKIVVFVR